jgi:hypothetical protein
MKRALLLGLGVLLLAAAGPAWAKSNQVVSYPPADVWPTAIRYLRLDRGATIREKDAESGYVLFDLPEEKKSYKGALELVRTTDGDEREATRIIVSLPDLPRHYELTLLEKLAAKIKDDYGTPAPAPPKKPPPESAKKPPSEGAVLPRPERGELPRPERR